MAAGEEVFAGKFNDSTFISIWTGEIENILQRNTRSLRAAIDIG